MKAKNAVCKSVYVIYTEHEILVARDESELEELFDECCSDKNTTYKVGKYTLDEEFEGTYGLNLKSKKGTSAPSDGSNKVNKPRRKTSRSK